jgi:hypothetical protein
MTNFQTNGCVLLKGFFDPQATGTISRYMEYAVKQQSFSVGDPISKYARYADPLIETVLYNSKEELEKITGFLLHPTYSYSRVYFKGDELKPHVDRPSCEVSVTAHIATQGDPWPIWMEVPGKKPVSFILEPGDAVVYKGCEVKHWREKAIDTELNAQIMLHYVNQNGPNASFKWDQRLGLGMSSSTRSM